MKQLLHICFFISVLFSQIESSAQSTFISAEIRPRFEVQYGYRIPPDTLSKPQILASQRLRLNVGYNSDRFNAYMSLQDARIWGDEVYGVDVASFGLHEGWAQYNFNNKVSLKGGRQELDYDNRRLLTNGEWPQHGRAHDALMLKLALNNGWKIDLAGAYNQAINNYSTSYYNLANYKTLNFLWLNKSKKDSIHNYSFSGIVLADGQQTPDTSGVNLRFTYGLNNRYDHYKWGINFEVYGQNGETRTVNQSGNIIPDSFQTVSAYMFSVNPWIKPFDNLQVGVGVDYLSGSDALDSTDNETHLFNPQFGAMDRYYGRIDLFFNIPADTRNAGLIDGYLNLRYDYKKWIINAVYHYFALANNVEDVENPGQPLDKPLGSEIDLLIGKEITKEVNLNAGLAFFFPTRSMEFVKTSTFSQVGGPTLTGSWFFFMLTFKPVFFSK